MIAVSGLLWALVVVEAVRMGNGPGTMGLIFPLFLAMWTAMMAAMMWPPLTPFAVARVGRVGRVGSTRAPRVAAFATGFLVSWAVYGAAVFLVVHRTGRLATSSPGTARWLGAGIFAAAGLYQLTPWKARALDHCHAGAHAGRARNSFSHGVGDGLMCVGCCWALMAVFIAVGVMNVWAMVGLAAVIGGEKLLPSRQARTVARVAGGVFVVLAVLALSHPSLLPGLHTSGAGSMGGMHMGG